MCRSQCYDINFWEKKVLYCKEAGDKAQICLPDRGFGMEFKELGKIVLVCGSSPGRFQYPIILDNTLCSWKDSGDGVPVESQLFSSLRAMKLVTGVIEVRILSTVHALAAWTVFFVVVISEKEFSIWFETD